MKYRVDATDSSVPQAHIPLVQHSFSENSELSYAADVGLGPGTAQMGAESMVVIAGMPHWSTASDLAQDAPPMRDSETGGHDSQLAEPVGGQSTDEPSADEQSTDTGGKDEATASVAEPPEGTQPDANFVPVWEVDRLTWPKSCDELYASEADYFKHAGAKLQEASQQGLRVLAIAASQAGQGCTTLAMCLARAVAAGGGRVALLDANFQHPALSTTLGLEFSRGWQDVVNGRLPLGEVAVASISDRVTLFPLADIQEPLEPARISEFLREVGIAADLVILDIGPLDTGPGCPFESGQSCPINAAIVVRDLRTTSEQETLGTANKLKNLGIDAIGVAENYASQQTAQAAA